MLIASGPLASFLEIPGVYRGMSFLALVVEGFLFWALWSKKWRELAFFVGFMLHINILLVVKSSLGLISFGLLSLSLYPLFQEFPTEKVMVDLKPFPYSRYILFLLSTLDWMNILHCQSLNNSASAKLTVIEPNGRKTVGSQAVYRLFSLLPLTSLLAIILRPRFSQRLLQKIAL